MKIGINGFGRIGRQVFRMAHEQQGIEVAHINDVAEAETLASLLQFDTTYGRWRHRVKGEGNVLHIDGTTISVTLDQQGWVADSVAPVEEGDVLAAACHATCAAVSTLLPEGVEVRVAHFSSSCSAGFGLEMRPRYVVRGRVFRCASSA